MKSKICIFFCALMIISFNISSCFLSTIISSDQYTTPSSEQLEIETNLEQNDQNDEQQTHDLHEHIQILDNKVSDNDNVKMPDDQNVVESVTTTQRLQNEPTEEIQVEDKQLRDIPLNIKSSESTPDGNEVPNIPENVPLRLQESSKTILIEASLSNSIDNLINNDGLNSTESVDAGSTEYPSNNHDGSIVNEAPSDEIQKQGTIDASKTQRSFKDEDILSSVSTATAKTASPEATPAPITQATDAEKNDTGVETNLEKTPSIELNLTVEENQIPVFSEWAQKRLEEVEKEVEQEVVNTSTNKKNTPTLNKQPVLKLKSAKNYASPDCGAKIIAANSESSGTGYVLTSTKDEYLLSPCKSRIWFVVELCEAIQAEHIDLANFELFSSSPKNFSVAVSNRFPTRDWSNVGKFIAKDERYVQSFDLFPHLFGKYVRVDIHSHYNSEHFCPISLFRVYGTSEFEAFETENRQHPIDDIDDDDDDDQEADIAKGKSNIFKSASDAVMSIVDSVKKAASFVKPQNNKTHSDDTNSLAQQYSIHSNCVTPNFVITCEKCTQNQTNDVVALLQCRQTFFNRLLSIELIRNSLQKSQICANRVGLDLQFNCREQLENGSLVSQKHTEYVSHLFPLNYIAAMCNLLAAVDKKIAWNSTYPLNGEPAANITIDKNAKGLLTTKATTKKGEIKIPTADQIPIPLDGAINDNGDLNTPSSTKEDGQKVDQSNNNIESKESINNNHSPKQNGGKNLSTVQPTPVPLIPPVENVEINSGENHQQNIFNVIETPSGNDPESESGELHGSGAAVHVQPEINNNNLEQIEETIKIPEVTTPTPNVDLVFGNEDNNGAIFPNAPQFGQKLHSESVFLRLSNRVKALERNMSLSGQYLEELSRRYKKQVEELQSSFAKTLLNIEEQSRRSLERKQELFEQNQKLRDDLEILTQRVFCWKNILFFCVIFIAIQVIIFYVLLKFCAKKYFVSHSEESVTKTIDVESNQRRRKSGNITGKFRRKSAEEKRQKNSTIETVAVQRRPSTEALNITGTYEELLIKDNDAITTIGDDHELSTLCTDERKSKLRKLTPHSKHEGFDDFVQIEDLKQLYDNPALNDDYEIYGPVSDLNCNKEFLCDDTFDNSETTNDSSVDQLERISKKGGVVSTSAKLKVAKNKNKSRRLSSPSFFKTPFSSGGKTSTERSTGWEWHRSKKSIKSSQTNNIIKKSKSESPEALRFNGMNNNNVSMPITPIINNRNTSDNVRSSNDSMRSSISSSIGSERKQPGSFRRLLKKMF